MLGVSGRAIGRTRREYAVRCSIIILATSNRPVLGEPKSAAAIGRAETKARAAKSATATKGRGVSAPRPTAASTASETTTTAETTAPAAMACGPSGLHQGDRCDANQAKES
jgi:hypothetical protein